MIAYPLPFAEDELQARVILKCRREQQAAIEREEPDGEHAAKLREAMAECERARSMLRAIHIRQRRAVRLARVPHVP